MNRQRDRKLIELFDAALDRPPQKRASFVQRACAAEPGLQGDLEAMLAADAGATRALGGQRRGAPDISIDETVSSPAPAMALADERSGPERLALTPGMRLDRYDLIRELGRGGMGTVYVARDTRLGRRVAIKFLQSRDPRLTERFVVEAQATARCSHESIVVIHDVKELGGHPFMVLEYLKGQSFSDLVGDDRLPPGRVVQLMVPVVRALECAHRHKIVHRDLKPANIFMTDTGTIKVLHPTPRAGTIRWTMHRLVRVDARWTRAGGLRRRRRATSRTLRAGSGGDGPNDPLDSADRWGTAGPLATSL